MRTLVQQIFAPRCPRCGIGKLFKDMLGIVDQCDHCGLVLTHHDAADAPAFFAIILIGLLVVLSATFVEFRFAPPLWLHATLWIPFTFVGCILCLRVVKTLMISIEFRLNQLKEKDPHA